jgi:hypothetical protein
MKFLLYVAIVVGLSLVLHFLLGWPVWVSLIVISVITTVPSWVAVPVRGALTILNYIIIRLVGLIPIYVLALVILYFSGHFSW